MFQLDLRGNKSIYEQIIDKFKEFIMRGTMKQGEKMPSVRELSKTLGVNPNTIQKAYRELERQGYIYTASGIGTFVADKNTIRPDEDELKKAREAALDYEARNIMGGGIGNLQDIYDALSGGRFRDNHTVIYGHGSSYYRSAESRVHETIANYAALSITRPDLIDLLRADKPDLVAELDAAIQELLKKAGG